MTGLTVTGADAGDFVITSDDCRGHEIDPRDACTVKVAFAPRAAGLRSATLEVMSNDPSGPAAIALSGTGGAVPAGLPTPRQPPSGLQGPAGPHGLPAPARAQAPTVKLICRNTGAATVLCSLVFAAGGASASHPMKAATYHVARGGHVLVSRRLTIRSASVRFRLPRLRPGRYVGTVTVGGRTVASRTLTVRGAH